MQLTNKAKEWFQDITEMDLDLMLSLGVITENRVMTMYYQENKRGRTRKNIKSIK